MNGRFNNYRDYVFDERVQEIDIVTGVGGWIWDALFGKKKEEAPPGTREPWYLAYAVLLIIIGGIIYMVKKK